MHGGVPLNRRRFMALAGAAPFAFSPLADAANRIFSTTTGILLADFTDGTHSLAASSSPGSADVLYDSGTPNAGARSYSLDENGIKIAFESGTTSQYSSAKWEPSGGVDLTGTDVIAVELDFPEGTGAFFSPFQVFITQQSGTTYTNYINKTLMSGADKMPHRMVLVMKLDSSWTLTGGGPAGWPRDITAGKIEFRLQVSASAQNYPAYCYVRKIWKGAMIPAVLFSFDDAHDAQLNIGAAALTAAGMKATLCASSAYIGQSNKLTAANCRTLYGTHGWDIGLQQTLDGTDVWVNQATTGSGLTRSGTTATWQNASSLAHNLSNGDSVTIRGSVDPLWNTTFTNISVASASSFTFTCAGTELTPAIGFLTIARLTDAQIAANIAVEKAFWTNLGLTRGNHFLAHSNGIVSDSALDAIRGAGIHIARTTNVGASPMAYCFDARLSDPRAMLMLPASTMDQLTAATVLARVDTAINVGATIHLYAHNIVNGAGTGTSLTVDQAEFEAIVDGIEARKARGLCHAGLTISEWNQERCVRT